MPTTPIWTPSDAGIAAANITAFRRAVASRWRVELPDYAALWNWSVTRPESFWTSVWEGDGGLNAVIGERGERVLLDPVSMPGARWFPDARLNFTENLLRRTGPDDAVVFWGEDRVRRRLSHDRLHALVHRCAAALRAAGVTRGDRVAVVLPNIPETLVILLACASLGAVFSSTSPDFGVQGVLDRFSQIRPKVLVGCDGYWYGGRWHDALARLAGIEQGLPETLQTVVVPYDGQRLAGGASAPGLAALRSGIAWADFLDLGRSLPEAPVERFPFDHPLCILFSSGTTGKPKCIVHGAGGVLLQHLKEHQLHGDVRPDDRVFYFTTCGWMMWNWLVSALAAQATLLLYDGSPFAGDGQVLFDYADAERMTHFGTSARYLDACTKADLWPARTHALTSLRVMFSTGSPLAPESYDAVARRIKPDLRLSSISGGTDIVSCFVLGCPILPVWRGEIQCRGLGMAVDVFDPDGQPVPSGQGELVCTRPFPSMPIGFWNDPDGSAYRAAYFQRYDGVWCHGDFCELTEHGGVIIHGRSDATLNPGGVRIGTAEIYRQVERFDEVLESLVIGQDWDGDTRIVLFVQLRDGLALTEALSERIRRSIAANTSRRHVPAKILQVTAIPRTRSGKIVELAVRNVVHGRPVTNVGALANPEALEQFRNRRELLD